MKPILFLLKSENHSPIPAGAHWITVRPPGHDKGQPILVIDQPDGSVKVVGGAGGALNHMRFRPKAQGQDHKQAAIERQKALREKRKAQIAADKEAGVHEQKQAARAQLLNERRKSEKEFIHAVADHMGWDKSQLEFDRSKFEHLSDKAVDKLERQHHAGLMQKAKEVAAQQRSWLVSDQEARAEAGLGEIPIHSEDSFQLSAQDLDPVRPKGGGLGFSPEYAERAAEQGATPEELAQEANAVKQADMTPEKRQAALRRGELAQQMKAELAGVKEPELPVVKQKIDDAKKAAAILAAQKRMALQAKAFKEANKQIDQGQEFEPKALALDTEDASQIAESVKRDIENDLRTISTASFIEHAHRHGTREEMAGHIATGAFNSVNSLALAVSGEALIDRSVVDVLGVDGAAKVLARRLASSMSPEDYQHVVAGMEDYHRHHYVETAAAAIKQADEAMAAVKDINLSDATDLETAQALNAKRRDAIEAARRVMGSAMGEMEANAALVAALRGHQSDKVEVPMGALTPDAIIQQARAIGLKKGQYAIERAGAESFLTVTGEGLDALSKPFSRDDLKQVQRNLDIMAGKYDEDDWLPMGFANRPDLAMHVEPGVAPSLAKPFQPSADIEQSLRDYIGGRIADGDAPLDILRDVQSYEFSQRSGVDGTTYIKALNAVVPLKGEDGEMRPIETMQGTFERYADDFVERHYGGQRQPLHRQSFELDDHAVESLHRALADHPDGLVAFKPIGELTHRDKRTLREFFYKHIAKETKEAADVRMELERLLEDEPEKHTVDMFGERSVSPDWTTWKNRCESLTEKRKSMSLLWDDYHKALFGRENAYASVQDLIKSNLSKKFAEHHAKLKPESALKVGKTVIRNNVSHLMAVDPKTSAARVAQEREMIDDLRERTSTGQYAAGSVKEKLDDYRQQREAFEQSQMGMFGSEDLFGGGDNAPAKPKEIKLDADERYTLGHVAERQIAGMMSVVGKNFKQGQKLKLWKASMSGKFIAQQRAIKMIDANKRVVLGYGAGSGKTGIMLGAFSHLHGQGKVKRAAMLVPSIVQGQFGGEALRYLEPGKFKWHAEPGASREERIAAYKDPNTHFVVMTHQSFRDDMVHLGAAHAGIEPSEMVERLKDMKPHERKAWIAGVMEKEGINFDATMVDEAHETVNRYGKQDSTLSNVVDALSDHTPYYVYASGDPVKNDVSEAADIMAKMDRQQYGDKAAFMRRYGADNPASRSALKREMARHMISNVIAPDVQARRETRVVPLSEGQKQALSELDKHFSKARFARMAGKVDVAACKAISPAAFEGVPEKDHEAVAREVQSVLGTIKSSARRRIINEHPDNAKIDETIKEIRSRKGKQGVVFAHNLGAVNTLKQRLEAEGIRVVTITGADSSQEKDRKRQLFTPESGEAQAEVMIASDAAAVGMNLQSGQYLIQHDVPDTAKTHGQRNARIHRLGQKQDVDLIDMVADHPDEHRARERLLKKYELRELMLSPQEGLDDTGIGHFIAQRRAEAAQTQGGLF